jgi:inhibitor of cysteine peptidase
VALLLLVTGGCRNGQGVSTTQPAGKDDIVTRVGQTFEIRVPSNPTTGYRWIIAPAVDEKIVHLVNQQYIRGGADMPGAGGEEVWTFKAVGAGRTEISMGYLRPWEMNTPVAKSRRYRVRVY